MRWQVVRDLPFVAHSDGRPTDRVTLRAGEVVESYPDGSMLGHDLVSWKRHQNQTAREDVAAKAVAILWLGKMRLVRAPADVASAQNARRLPD